MPTIKKRDKQQNAGSGPQGTVGLLVRMGLFFFLAGAFSAPSQDYLLGSFSAKTGSGVPASAEHLVSGGINLGILVASEDENHLISGSITGGGLVMETVDGTRLTIERVPGGIEVSWPEEPTGFVLEVTSSLAAPDWQQVTAPEQGPGSSSVVIPIVGATQFYRLRRLPAD